MKVISHSQKGFLALYVIALRKVEHERESSRSSGDRAKACTIIQTLLTYNAASFSLCLVGNILFCHTCNLQYFLNSLEHRH